METLRIGALAKRAGVGVETVRFYERQGLILQPAKRSQGYRSYPLEVLDQIRFIRQAQALGFTLEEVAALLALRTNAGAKCTAVRARAVAKHVDEKREQLQRIREALEKFVASCPGKGPLRACTIMQALESEDPVVSGTAPPPRRRRKGNAPVKSVDITIEGMNCHGCASTIQSLLTREPGVRSANVSFTGRKATVLYDPKQTDPGKVATAIEKAGFRTLQ